MSASGTGSPTPPLQVQDITADPEAMRWATVCAWLPGTGYCGNRECSVDCVFRPQREADAGCVQRWRRLRRTSHRRPVR